MSKRNRKIQNIRETFPQITLKVLPETLVLSQLEHPLLFFLSLNKRLMEKLERLLKWTDKTIYYRDKNRSSDGLKLEYNIVPTNYRIKATLTQ